MNMMMKPKSGAFKIPDSEYFKIDALSNSGFRLLKESVLHYENRDLFELQGASLNIGSALHKLVLEEDTFYDDFITEYFEGCELNKNTKAYKEAKAKWIETVKDKTILSINDFEKVEKMAKNVRAIAGGLLQNGVAEQAFLSSFDNIPVKCKVDYYIEQAGVVIDLKTTKSIKDFKKSIIDYGYGTQAPFYIDVLNSLGKNATRFVFILVETVAPYMVSIQEMEVDSINLGRKIYSEYLKDYKEYKINNQINVIKSTGYPEWFKNNN
jgi:hypothetical protein